MIAPSATGPLWVHCGRAVRRCPGLDRFGPYADGYDAPRQGSDACDCGSWCWRPWPCSSSCGCSRRPPSRPGLRWGVGEREPSGRPQRRCGRAPRSQHVGHGIRLHPGEEHLRRRPAGQLPVDRGHAFMGAQRGACPAQRVLLARRAGRQGRLLRPGVPARHHQLRQRPQCRGHVRDHRPALVVDGRYPQGAPPGGHARRHLRPVVLASVANALKANPAVVFDLFNEPYPNHNTDSVAAWTCVLKGSAGGTCSGLTYRAAGMQQLVTRCGAPVRATWP